MSSLCIYSLLLVVVSVVAVDVELRVSNAEVSPDGGPARLGVVVNGEFGGPLITVAAGDVINMTLINDYDNPEYSGYFGGTSVHFHGFSMRGVPYLDGTSYISQCPVQRGERQFVEFTVNEEPGTYMWHDHKNMAVADGLAGGLIVTGPADEALKELFNVTRDEVLVVTDWFEQNSVTQGKGINAPVDVQNFTWTARSLLLNWKGCYNDCSAGDEGMFSCDPDPNCEGRYVLDVAPTDAIRLRLVGAGSMMYQIVCFEGVGVTLVAMDAREVEPMVLADGCVNVNLGQRTDVIIKGKTFEELDATFDRRRSFWVTGYGDKGNPASYGVVSYAGCTDASECLPDTPPPQPSDRPISWSASGYINDIKSPQARRIPEYVRDGREPDKRLTLQLTSPVIQQTSQARWAISNAVYLKTPGCGNVLQQAGEPAWLRDDNPYVVSNSSALENVDIYNMPGLGGDGMGSGESLIYLNLAGNTSLAPEQPVAGTPIVQTASGEVVDLVLQNLPDGTCPSSVVGWAGSAATRSPSIFHRPSMDEQRSPLPTG